ncbi:MAG TPA: hypothetical protein VH186_09220 [Chloroflexia bacterium]|nr:hypothetical protein [Chloroflexia bacterium]
MLVKSFSLKNKFASSFLALLLVVVFSFSALSPLTAGAAAPQLQVAGGVAQQTQPASVAASQTQTSVIAYDSATPTWHYVGTYLASICTSLGQSYVSQGTAQQYACRAISPFNPIRYLYLYY